MYKTFEEFWLFYVSEHMKRSTRIWHAAGTFCVIVLLLVILFTQRWWLLSILLVVGYGPAWVSHFFIERNKPATFKHPLQSLRADFRMFWYTVTGRMEREVDRAKRWLQTRALH